MTPKIERIRQNNRTMSRQMDAQIGPTTLDMIGQENSMHPLNYEGVGVSPKTVGVENPQKARGKPKAGEYL